MFRTLASAALVAFLGACSPADAPSPTATSTSGAVLSYTDAFVMAPIGNTGPTMGGVTLQVEGGDVRLIGASSTDFSAIELHTMTMIDGKMRMRPAETGFEIADGETLRLRRGGNHMMMFDPSPEVTRGETVDITLNFEADGEPLSLVVEADVRALGD